MIIHMDIEVALHPNGSNIIYTVCFIQLIPFGYSVYYQMYDSTTVIGIVFFTSINYWRKPSLHSIRRYMDMQCVILAVLYHLYLIHYYSLSRHYYYMIGISSLLYPIEYLIPCHKYYCIAICHSILQIMACYIFIRLCTDLQHYL